MKKVILMMCLAFAFSQTSTAQLSFGLKGGINYSSNTISEVKNDVLNGVDNNTGYHAGIWLRAKIPVIGLYIRPELVYTNLENQVEFGSLTKSTTFNFQKIDVPVLLGKKIFGVGNVFAGPSFQYVLSQGFSTSDFKDIETDDFTVGMQLGAGIELGKIGIDVRWERGFNNVETKLANGISDNLSFDTRVNQIILGISYKL